MLKKLSIIIPAYNAENYIEKCLNSIEDKDSIEIIVINDGSTDKTMEILNKYKNIKIINNTNHGVSYSRNSGLKVASGKYIMFVDSDDYLNFYVDKYDLDNLEYDIIYFNKFLTNINLKESLYEYICGLKKPIIAGPCCKLIKLSFVKKNKIFFNENIINGEDMLFNIECINKAKNFKIINENIYMYRQVVGTATKKFDDRIIKSDYNFQILLKKHLDESNLSDVEKNKIITYSILNGIITLFDRISYVNDYSEFRNKILFIKSEPYCLLNKTNLMKEPINNKSKIILILIKFKLYKLIYLLFRNKHKKYINNKEIFIEI